MWLPNLHRCCDKPLVQMQIVNAVMVVLYLLVMAVTRLLCCKPGSSDNLMNDISLQTAPDQCCWHAVARIRIMLVDRRTRAGACQNLAVPPIFCLHLDFSESQLP